MADTVKRTSVKAYINDAYCFQKDKNTVKNELYCLIADAIKNKDIWIDSSREDLRSMDDYVFGQDFIYVENSDFYLSYMYNTNVKSMNKKEKNHQLILDSKYRSIIDVRDIKVDKSLFHFVDEFCVSGLFDLIQQKRKNNFNQENKR